MMCIAVLWAFMAAGAVQAAERAPDNAYDHADQGFRAYAAGDYKAAVSAFDAALALDPTLVAVAAQRAYALKKLYRNREAAQSFRMAIAQDVHGENEANGNNEIYAREIRTLENRFDLSYYAVYRPAAHDTNFLAIAGPSLTQSQSGLEAAWTPPVIGYRDGRTVQVFGRVLWGYLADSFIVDRDSWQAGAGLRWKPFRETNLVFSGERLFAIGYNARNDWMLRASYSRDKGYAFDGRRKHWTYATFYADAAVIRPADPDLVLASEARLGETFRLGRMITVTPHAMLAGVVQVDQQLTTSILEGGPGLSIKLHGNGRAASYVGDALELLIQYRQKLAGSSTDTSGFVMTLVVQY